MLTIISAKFSNPLGTAVVAVTEESGSVLITQSPGKAEKWAALQAWIAAGGVVELFVPSATPASPPDPVVELAGIKGLIVEKGIVSQAELDDALRTKRVE